MTVVSGDGVFTTAVEGNKAETDTMKLKKEGLLSTSYSFEVFLIAVCNTHQLKYSDIW